MWDYESFLVTGDVAQSRADDHTIYSRSSDFTYLREYVATSDKVKIHFKEDLISSAHLGSYNS